MLPWQMNKILYNSFTPPLNYVQCSFRKEKAQKIEL